MDDVTPAAPRDTVATTTTTTTTTTVVLRGCRFRSRLQRPICVSPVKHDTDAVQAYIRSATGSPEHGIMH